MGMFRPGKTEICKIVADKLYCELKDATVFYDQIFSAIKELILKEGKVLTGIGVFELRARDPVYYHDITKLKMKMSKPYLRLFFKPNLFFRRKYKKLQVALFKDKKDLGYIEDEEFDVLDNDNNKDKNKEGDN